MGRKQVSNTSKKGYGENSKVRKESYSHKLVGKFDQGCHLGYTHLYHGVFQDSFGFVS